MLSCENVIISNIYFVLTVRNEKHTTDTGKIIERY